MKLRNWYIRPKMKYDVMDVRNMTYKNSTFDIVFDKSTMDTILCGSGSYKNVALMLWEV